MIECDKEAKLIVIPMPCDLNPQGNIFGGWIMSQMDLAGAIVAKEITKGIVATVAVKDMVFKIPILAGDVVKFYADVVNIGNTSINVNVKVFTKRHNLNDNKFVFVAEGNLIYVSIDSNGNKIKIKK